MAEAPCVGPLIYPRTDEPDQARRPGDSVSGLLSRRTAAAATLLAYDRETEPHENQMEAVMSAGRWLGCGGVLVLVALAAAAGGGRWAQSQPSFPEGAFV